LSITSTIYEAPVVQLPSITTISKVFSFKITATAPTGGPTASTADILIKYINCNNQAITLGAAQSVTFDAKDTGESNTIQITGLGTPLSGNDALCT